MAADGGAEKPFALVPVESEAGEPGKEATPKLEGEGMTVSMRYRRAVVGTSHRDQEVVENYPRHRIYKRRVIRPRVHSVVE